MSSPKKEFDIDSSARWTMGGAIFLTLAALWVVPTVWSGHPVWWTTYNQNTGVVGDTIGGIASPILNFAGLIIVYYTLREQIATNKAQAQQLRQEVTRSLTEREFELTLRLIEKLIEEARYGSKAFEEIGLKEWEMTFNNDSEKIDLYSKYMRRVKNLADSFLMLIKRLESVNLSLEQQSISQRILTMQYEPFLLECQLGYQTYFNNAENEPMMLKLINNQLDVLDKQRNRIDSQMSLPNDESKAN